MNTPAACPALLLCIDLQPVFIRAMHDHAVMQRRCAFAVAAAQGLGLPVIFTEQVPARLGGTAPELSALAPDAPVCAKETFSAWADPAIRATVARHAPAQLLLCGLETPVCICQTALAAHADDQSVVILSDAVGARRPEDARVCLDALTRSGVGLLPAETVFYALLGSAQHPFFKAYTQLVKTHG
jgi:nicotinamidase-related amidase